MSEQDQVNLEQTPAIPHDQPRASDILQSFLYDAHQTEARKEIFGEIQQLYPHVTAEQITTWLNRFNGGIQIVKKDYGTEPADIKLVDEIGLQSGKAINDRAVYINGRGTIAVPLNFIGFQAGFIGNANILASYNLPEDAYIGVEDLPTIEGFEEAYHYVQEKRDGILQTTKDITDTNDPHEQEVRSLIPKLINKEGIRHYEVPKTEIAQRQGHFVVVSQPDVSKFVQLTPLT